jgi:hypothetical protein
MTWTPSSGKNFFLPLPGLKLRPLSRPAHTQSLYQLCYTGSLGGRGSLIWPLYSLSISYKLFLYTLIFAPQVHTHTLELDINVTFSLIRTYCPLECDAIQFGRLLTQRPVHTTYQTEHYRNQENTSQQQDPKA